MKRFSLLIVALALALVGCANSTPQQRYDQDAFVWPLLKNGAYAYTAQNPVTPAQAAIIETNIAQGDKNLADASIWLQQNAAIKDIPGSGPPSLNDFSVISQVLGSVVPQHVTTRP